MEGLKILKYSSIHFQQWNEFLSHSKNANFLFHRNFMDYHKDRYVDHSLMIFKNEKLIGLLPANIDENIIYSHQGLTYGGLVLLKQIKFEMVFGIFKSVLEFLEKSNISKLFLKQIPSIYHTEITEEIDYIMFLVKANLVRRDVLSVIDLRENFKISNNRFEGQKRGIKNDLIIKEEKDLESFWKLILIPTLNHKHQALPVHSLSEISQLKKHFPKNIRHFNVYHDNKIVAGTTIFESEYVAHAQYIAANEEKNSLGSLDFLYLHLIEKIFKDKRYFDFGISNENDGLNINKGLQFWKEGFGARSLTQDFYMIETNKKSVLDSVYI